MTDRNREELIEKRKAVQSMIDSGMPSDVVSAQIVMFFEQAHTPTSDEWVPTPPDGWFTFGSHAPYPWIGVEFSEAVGEDGLPLFERPKSEPQAEPTDAVQDAEEPEYEYGVMAPSGRMVNNGDYQVQQTHRRRKAGPWEAIEQGDAS